MVSFENAPLYLHLARTRNTRDAAIVRVHLYEWFRLGPAEVIKAPREHLCRTYSSFNEAAALVSRELYGELLVFWEAWEIYVRLGPVQREHLGTLECRVFVHSRKALYTRASPRLAAHAVVPLPEEDGTGEWVQIGLLRPFVPPGIVISRAEVEAKVEELISEGRHNMSRNSGGARGRRHKGVHRPDQQAEGGCPDGHAAPASRLGGERAPAADERGASSELAVLDREMPRDLAGPGAREAQLERRLQPLGEALSALARATQLDDLGASCPLPPTECSGVGAAAPAPAAAEEPQPVVGASIAWAAASRLRPPRAHRQMPAVSPGCKFVFRCAQCNTMLALALPASYVGNTGFLVAWNGATADRNPLLLRRLEEAVQYVVGFHGYLQRGVGDAATLLLLEGALEGASPGERGNPEQWEWEGGDWMRATMQGWRSDDYG
ncbi:hypothetical protein EMIHUDRAFT_196411 [Emiliania huxleyi CCMP1516]|uniref:Yippee domain-containing protein n=2 Tax=Emiliania huxleyi TaxID=2903 RepID=A0A0D3J422_EMIH1|nr:hypothetical protein EMIHUDRAFT_196411 [Emiliania huxleyi CCMP1516]EOD18257.1 hypothetical protein EMIHUDRAFT_196411 [Emiliania huxleyi CCMP1516]|eukprot:XP_005770686.1 hypothetical protein EMIHUDRAFT_196411 [Emiliania huxleyi CCMP1516]